MSSTRPLRTAPRTRLPGLALRPSLALLCLLLGALALLVSVPTAQAATSQVASSARLSAVAVPRCNGYAGARALGSYYADAFVRVDACGQRPSFDGARSGGGPVVRPYAGSPIYYRGYQCIELVARYLKARFDANPGVANGAQAVDRYVNAYPRLFVRITNGTRAKAPRKGDVLSLSRNARFNDVGHTGIVVASAVNAAGNGTIRAVEENWGGAGGSSGYHTYPVRKWSVVSAGLPYVKWLRSR